MNTSFYFSILHYSQIKIIFSTFQCLWEIYPNKNLTDGITVSFQKSYEDQILDQLIWVALILCHELTIPGVRGRQTFHSSMVLYIVFYCLKIGWLDMAKKVNIIGSNNWADHLSRKKILVIGPWFILQTYLVKDYTWWFALQTIFLFFVWFLVEIGRNGECLGHLLWPVIWSKTVPHVRHTHAESHVHSHDCQHPTCSYLGKHKFHSDFLWPGSWNSCRSWNLCYVYASKPFCLWPSTMPQQILANTKYCISNDVQLRNYHITTCTYMLDSGVQIRTRKQRSCCSKCHILLVECYYTLTLYQVFSFVCKNLERLFQRGIA